MKPDQSKHGNEKFRVRAGRHHKELRSQFIIGVFYFLIAASSFLFSCGGGGGGSSPNSTHNTQIGKGDGSGDSTNDKNQKPAFKIEKPLYITIDQSGDTPNPRHFIKGKEPDLSKENRIIKTNYKLGDIPLYRSDLDKKIGTLEVTTDGYVLNNTLNVKDLKVGENSLEARLVDGTADIKKLEVGKIKKFETDKNKCLNETLDGYVKPRNPTIPVWVDIKGHANDKTCQPSYQCQRGTTAIDFNQDKAIDNCG